MHFLPQKLYFSRVFRKVFAPLKTQENFFSTWRCGFRLVNTRIKHV